MKMKKLLSVLTAAVLGMAFALPLNAAPISVPKPEQVQKSAVEQVKHRKHWRHKHYRHWRGGRHWNGRYARWDCCYYGSCYPRRYYRPYYSPYYGYRDYYPRYYRGGSGVSIYLQF
jgi:arylamine N-acetyltransferase